MKIELCAAGIDAVFLAQKKQVDRIELCEALELGGITPSPAMQQKAISLFKETHILIRPRSGDFIYSELEKEVMLEDVHYAVQIGARGIVSGALTPEKKIDTEFIKLIRVHHPKIQFTFHRAFDEVINPLEAIDTLVTLGVNRILMSGGAVSLMKGLEVIKQCIKKANGKIEIMIGGGVNEENLETILKQVNPDAIHFSGTVLSRKKGNSIFENERLLLSEQKVDALISLIRKS